MNEIRSRRRLPITKPPANVSVEIAIMGGGSPTSLSIPKVFTHRVVAPRDDRLRDHDVRLLDRVRVGCGVGYWRGRVARGAV